MALCILGIWAEVQNFFDFFQAGVEVLDGEAQAREDFVDCFVDFELFADVLLDGLEGFELVFVGFLIEASVDGGVGGFWGVVVNHGWYGFLCGGFANGPHGGVIDECG